MYTSTVCIICRQWNRYIIYTYRTVLYTQEKAGAHKCTGRTAMYSPVVQCVTEYCHAARLTTIKQYTCHPTVYTSVLPCFFPVRYAQLAHVYNMHFVVQPATRSQRQEDCRYNASVDSAVRTHRFAALALDERRFVASRAQSRYEMVSDGAGGLSLVM